MANDTVYKMNRESFIALCKEYEDRAPKLKEFYQDIMALTHPAHFGPDEPDWEYYTDEAYAIIEGKR